MNTDPAGTPEVLVITDQAAWRVWLDLNEASSDGVWLLLAKKGTVAPTSLSYAQALDEALCSGWIDGQKKSYDEATFLQRFTPRRARSLWSQRNVEHMARLSGEGRVRPSGHAEINRAKADGRWDRAYSGSAQAEVPADLTGALSQHEGALAHFSALGAQARYSILFPLMTASTPENRSRRLAKAVAQILADVAQATK